MNIEKLIPKQSREEIESLKNDIKKNGIQIPVVIDSDGKIIDGFHRNEIGKQLKKDIPKVKKEFKDEKEKIKYALSLNLKRRQLSTEQLKDIAKKLKEEKWTQEEIAESLGVSQQFISKWIGKKIATITTDGIGSKTTNISSHDCRRKIPKEDEFIIYKRLEKGETHEQIADDLKCSRQSISKIKKKIENQIEEQKQKDEKRKKLKDDPKIINKDFIDVVPEKKIDLILTDPPYGIKYIEQWKKLAEWAKLYLKPNGFLISYFGELNLPQFYFELSKQLDYYWTFCLIHKGNKQLINPRNIFCGWKPIVVYQNSFKKINKTVEDIIYGTGREKNEHEWQQAEDEIESIILNFSDEGDLICDPFMGSGTILKKAKNMNRNILGIEIDKNRYDEGVLKING